MALYGTDTEKLKILNRRFDQFECEQLNENKSIVQNIDDLKKYNIVFAIISTVNFCTLCALFVYFFWG